MAFIFLDESGDLGFNFESTYKIIIGSSFLLSFASFYIWFKRIAKEDIAFL